MLSNKFSKMSKQLFLHEILTDCFILSQIVFLLGSINMLTQRSTKRSDQEALWHFLHNTVMREILVIKLHFGHVTPESKQQSMEQSRLRYPKEKVFKTKLSALKIMCTVFWNRESIFLVEFLSRGRTINAVSYFETLRILFRAVQNKRRGMLSQGTVMLHDTHIPILLVSLRI